MTPTAIDLYTDIYSGLLDAKLGLRDEERQFAALAALQVAYTRLCGLDNLLSLIAPSEKLTPEPEVPHIAEVKPSEIGPDWI